MLKHNLRWLRILIAAPVLLTSALMSADAAAGDGTIEGIVVRAADQTPVARAEVILRAKVDGQLVSVAETTAHAEGRFRFEHLAADGSVLYLPGANRDGIHYPGPGVRLTSLVPRAEVKLMVHDAVAFPSPLVVRRHEITLSPGPAALQVTETMLIDNPSAACYVGQAPSEGVEPVTLQLGIPANFQRITFASEFFGRRFALVGGKLVTSVPWPPGKRELKFSYVLPGTEQQSDWQRPLDLPTAEVRVSVQTDQPDEITCNLPATPRLEQSAVSFETADRTLPAGHQLCVELGRPPISLMAVAPWLALALLGISVFTTHLVVRRRKSDTAP